MASHIVYQMINGIEYARLATSIRVGEKVDSKAKTLGRVLDKEKGIFRSKERGVFTYNHVTGEYGIPPASFSDKTLRKDHKEKLILDFGDAFFLHSYIRKSGLIPAIEAIGYGNNDTLNAIIMYYVLCLTANCHAEAWYEGSYARMLYPEANITGQRISEMLCSIGDEWSYREFFKEYAKLLKKRHEGADILIDSTGLPNSIHFPLTAVSNHNGEISNEVRLIYAVQQGTNLPLYFRYCPGNVIDVSTLCTTINEIKAYNIDIKFAILDAGYLSDDNINELYDGGISFVSRVKENTRIYKDAIKNILPSIEKKENRVTYNGRYAFIEKSECIVGNGHKAYLYLGLDISMKNHESVKLMERATHNRMKTDEVFEAMERQGVFALISSRPIARDKILPTYYTRAQIEQVFDLCKNNTNMLPLRVHTEETFRGHLLIAFVASVIAKKLQEELKDTSLNPASAFQLLRNQKCKVFADRIIPQEAVKKVNDLYKKFGMKSPKTIARKPNPV